MVKIVSLFKKKLFFGFLIGIVFYFLSQSAVHYTSTDKFCESCHVHPHAKQSWIKSSHFDNKSGIAVHCVECHLPPRGVRYLTEKARLGFQDIYGKVFKDIDKINWDEKSRLEHAVSFTYKESCMRCHQNLFPLGLSKKGEDAHLYYTDKADKLRCLNCHLHVGHYSEEAQKEFQVIKKNKAAHFYTQPAQVVKFEDFTEFVPQSGVSFDMVAIPGGTFNMGSPEKEAFHKADESPVHEVQVKSFWMGKAEVSWDEYETFYVQTATEGRTDTRMVLTNVDAITGPTPAYGNPDQGWGRGKRPAITMTFYAANVYCKWLSKITGKKYRLPTEAEWEYACRAGTDGPYFFNGDPKKYTKNRLWNKVFGADTTTINSFVIYANNSHGRTQPFSAVHPNPFGLYNMLGNVREFCSDWYDAAAYAQYPAVPQSGLEHVVRGGSFKSDAADIRCATRDFTRHDAWMMTDPQMPKSLWWYSDCDDVGFRVVCEFDGK